MIKSKEINEKKIKKGKDDYISDIGNYLNYLKITGQDKIEELDNEAYLQQCMMFSSTLAQENEDNIGKEINKFFNLILTENKEGEPLKVNIAMSNRFNKEKVIDNQINYILNKNFDSELVLDEEMSENIATILTIIYQKIQSKFKFNSYQAFVNKINNYNLFERDILKDYLITEEESRQRNMALNSPAKPDYEINRFLSTSPMKSRKTVSIPDNSSKKNISTKIKNRNSTLNKTKIIYEFREKNSDKNLGFPIEILILKRKFQTIKKIKLMISNSVSRSKKNIFDSESFSDKDNSFINVSFSSNLSEINLKQKDIQNIIFVLLNLNWLFFNIIEIEIDLSNDNIIKEQILLYKSSLKHFSKLLKRNIKNTDYSQNKIKKINYDPLHGSIFENYVQLDEDEDEDSYSSSGSYSLKVNAFQKDDNIFNLNDEQKVSNTNFEENQIESFDNLIKKYQYTLQMIIISAFFMSKIPNLFFCNFTIPFNFENEILRMLQIHQIYIADFNLLSFLSDAKMIRITIDFNSLDNKAFQEVLSLLFKNNNLRICQLNFFPSENYFIPELLLKLLQECNSNYKLASLNNDKSILGKIEPHEDIDIFLFKKLSEYFESNINKLFLTLCIKSTVEELSLIFNVPSLLKKIDFYLRIILKFILNIFISIDNMKLNLKTFNLQTSNFFFDGNKYPFLLDFLDKIYIFSNSELNLTKLTCQMKFKNITNIYRIIPYNVMQLSIGELDYETFIYFIEYITSSQFSTHSNLLKLKINLSNSLLDIDNSYEYLIKLFTEYPKGLKEIGINTQFIINKEQIDFLLKQMDYNTLENIFFNFNKLSLDEKGFESIKNDIFIASNENVLNNNNYMKLYFTKRTIKSTAFIMSNIMNNLSIKYNKFFMDYNIFKNMEKYICEKEEKKYMIKFT
jgi:hypothetical protein